MDVRAQMTDADAALGRALIDLYEVANILPPASVAKIVDVVCYIVGAQAGRLLVADYGLLSLRELGPDGPVGESVMIEGTVAGRVFSDSTTIATGEHPTVLHVPLVDGSERIGVLELDFDTLDEVPIHLAPIIVVLVPLLVAKSRYTDAWVRCRRARPLTPAAEVQWALLPPLAASADHISVAGILEPAYSIGGDSFDYALNNVGLEFAIVDAMGRGMSAVLMSVTAINALRNVRRESRELAGGYEQVDRLISQQFGGFSFVTGQFGTLNSSTGMLRWVNAGHPPPLLVRNGTFAGELVCEPSMPMGLGGTVVKVAEEPLQSGDQVLFYTDGITESRSADGEIFGTERLADYLVRASLDRVPAAETVRRLSANLLTFVGAGLRDDATLFLVEYRVDRPPDPDDILTAAFQPAI